MRRGNKDADPLVTMAIYNMKENVGKSMIRDAMKLQHEINAANAEGIGALMMKDLGKKKFAEVCRRSAMKFHSRVLQASKLSAEINESNAEAIAATMMRGAADKKHEEAVRLQAEIHQTNADMIGSIMAKDLGKKKFEEAESGPRSSTIL